VSFNNRHIALCVFATPLVLGNMGGGATSQIHNTAVFVSGSLWSVISAVALVFLVLFYPRPMRDCSISRHISLSRRLVAFILDFGVVLGSCIPIIVMFELIIESYHAGVFSWSYRRDYLRMTDTVSGLMTIFIFWMLFKYFASIPANGRQTVGQYICGYKIVPQLGIKKANPFGWRAFYGFFALCWWPFTALVPSLNTPVNGQYWWGINTGTKAIWVGGN